MAAPEVLVIGDANPDLVLTGDVDPRFGQVEKLVDTASLVLGASGAIVAAGLARLGVRTALAAVVGDDVFGRFVLDELTACQHRPHLWHAGGERRRSAAVDRHGDRGRR